MLPCKKNSESSTVTLHVQNASTDSENSSDDCAQLQMLGHLIHLQSCAQCSTNFWLHCNKILATLFKLIKTDAVPVGPDLGVFRLFSRTELPQI